MIKAYVATIETEKSFKTFKVEAVDYIEAVKIVTSQALPGAKVTVVEANKSKEKAS